jgi:Acyl-CoA dehydrogenase, C-terminal domain
MNFDLDESTARVRTDAGTAAAGLAAAAHALDVSGEVPSAARAAARAAVPAADVPLPWVVAIEEIAAVSGSLAVDAALPGGDGAGARSWMGLRGVDLDGARRARDHAARDLAVAAVLVGLGRSAIGGALDGLRAAKAAGGRPEQQHWGLADAATEVDAARLLLWRAAAAMPPPAGGVPAAMARMQARAAAESAVAVARRVLGAEAGVAGTTLDRITRDVATATLVFGGADGEEAAVAAGVLPG